MSNVSAEFRAFILPVASEVREYGIHRNLRRKFRSRVSCAVRGAKFSVENTAPVDLLFLR
jgi:hypothetical protein